MAGLLDFLSSPEASTGLGLLAAAGPRFDGAGFGQRLLEGVQYGQQRMDAEEKRKAAKAAMEMQAMQMQEMKQKIAEQQQMRELAARFQIPAQQGLAPLQGDSQSGILPSAGRAAVPAGFDYQGYAGAMAGVDPMKALALQQLMKKDQPKFGTEPRYDQSGRAFILAEDGSMKYLDGVKARDKLNEVRLGDKVGFRTDYSPELQGSLPIGQSLDSRMSNQVTMRGQNMTDARSREQFDFTKGQEGKPQLVDNQWVYKPTEQNPQGRVVAIPGLSDKPLTESQGAATNFGMRSIKANEILTDLEKNGSGQAGNIKRFMTAATPGLGMGLDESMGALTNWTQSSKQQMSEQARLDFLTAVLRKESGASISPGEHITAQRQYFVQPGDSDAVIEQKRKNRETAIQGLRMQAGPGAKTFSSGGASGGWGIEKVN
jgi:hypothetical protein